jgi:holo-[acyl-carrier protein] synthase
VIGGIGVDLVEVARMRAALARYGERFAARILTAAELEEFRCSARPAQFLAKRFAAKEALVKAVGTGFRFGLGLREVGVAHDPLGRPYFVLSATAARVLAERGLGECHLSLADEQEHALAFVALVRGALSP